MNYQTSPDIDPSKPLTPDAVVLFQRFQQDADRATVDALIHAEVDRHLKLCELTILYYASCSYYWCELPEHPIMDVNTWTLQALEKRGFQVERHSAGRRRKVSDEADRQRVIEGVYFRDYSTASWLSTSLSAKGNREWRRRVRLENAERKQNPPKPCSRLSEGKIVESNAIWAGILDGDFLVEVQEIHHRSFLCVFNLAGECLHSEETSLAYGATFGPDSGDVREWQERGARIVKHMRM